MGNVDAITRQILETNYVYLYVAKILRNNDELKHLDSYDDAALVTKGPTRLNTFNDNIFVPILTVQCIRNMSQPANIAPTAPPLELLCSHLVNSPLMMYTTTPQPLRDFNNETTSLKQFEVVKNLGFNWLCIDDVISTSLLWSSTHSNPPICWNVQNFFASSQTSDIFFEPL